MRILFVAPRFHTNQFQLIKTLLEKKHTIFFHVACIGATEDHTLVTPIRFKQSALSLFIEKFLGKGGVNRRYYFPDLSTYWRFFRRLKPELVIIRDPYKLFSLLVACCARLVNAKIIFYTQEDMFRSRSTRTLLKQQLTIRFFRAAWMTPVRAAREAGNGRGLKYMYHVPLPVAVRRDDAGRDNITGEGPRILMIGKYHQERKKHLLFLQALHQLKKRYRFKATITGECARDDQQLQFANIRYAAKHLELDNLVELKQNIPYNKMEELYASHHIFVLPAINEPYAVSVNEAMGYSLPVICTDTCGTRFNISNGYNGFVIKSGSLDELTASLETLISDYHKLGEMRKRSLQYARENLSTDVFYSRFTDMTRERFSIELA